MNKIRRLASVIPAVLLAAGLFLSCRESSPPAPEKASASPSAGKTVQPFLNLVEGDAVFYLGMRDWRDLEVFEFVRTARRLRIAERVKEMLDPGMPQFEGRTGAERRLRELAELREKVSLRELLGGEFALVIFPGPEGKPPVPALILRLPAGKADLYAEYFRELAVLSDAGGEGVTEAESGLPGLSFNSFLLPGGEVRAVWCRSGDILVAATSRERVETVVARILGRGEGPSLAGDRVFRESFRGLDPSARGVFYLKTRPLVASLVEGSRKAELPEGAGTRFYLRGLRRVVETVGRIAGNFDFDSRAYREEVRIYLDEKNGSRALLDLVRIPPRTWEVLDYIPAGVADFSAGFLDPQKVYRPLIDFIAAGSPAGKELIETWEEKQAAAGIRVEENILSWLGDEFAVCTVSLGQSLFDPGGGAVLLRFTSAGDLDRLLADLVQRARAEDLNVVAEEYDGVGFNILYLPVPLFPVTPAAGRVGEFLVLASRRDIFTRIVDTYNSSEPSIRRDPDFLRLSAELDGAGSGIYFSRLEDKIEALIAVIRSSASMVGLLLPPPGAADESGEITGPDSRQVIELLNDVTRVLEDLKIFRFRAGTSLYRNGYIQSRSVVEIGD